MRLEFNVRDLILEIKSGFFCSPIFSLESLNPGPLESYDPWILINQPPLMMMISGLPIQHRQDYATRIDFI